MWRFVFAALCLGVSAQEKDENELMSNAWSSYRLKYLSEVIVTEGVGSDGEPVEVVEGIIFQKGQFSD